jgi:hypothetical protein
VFGDDKCIEIVQKALEDNDNACDKAAKELCRRAYQAESEDNICATVLLLARRPARMGEAYTAKGKVPVSLDRAAASRATGSAVQVSEACERQQAVELAWLSVADETGTCGQPEAVRLLAAQLERQLKMHVGEEAVATLIARSPCAGLAALDFDAFVSLWNDQITTLSRHLDSNALYDASSPR